MCLSKYSNLELLKEVVKSLYSSEEYGNINGLSEKKLAELINNFYQVRYLSFYYSRLRLNSEFPFF